MIAPQIATTSPLRLFTVDDFAKMTEVGILTESERLELIEGIIHSMSPIGSLHSGLVIALTYLLNSQLSKYALVSVQNPIQLNERNMPQPDLTIIKPRKDYYETRHPQPSDVFIVIEVSDSTLEMDRTIKAPLYAAEYISEYWIVDAVGKTLEQYTQPTAQGYAQKLILKTGDTLKTTQFPEFALPINELFRVDSNDNE